MTHNPCILIPHYNHHLQAEPVVKSLAGRSIPIIVIDDGSRAESLEGIRQIAAQFENVTLIELSRNRGKGAAVLTGFVLARQKGFSHALQVDADGQHDLNDLDQFLSESRRKPDSIIAGCPVFDESAPSARRMGRKLTDLMVVFETLSFSFRDAMCGYRVYPLDSISDVTDRYYIGNGMDFDTEILVKSHWMKIPNKFIETRVIYPESGASNFRMLRDNVVITKMHVRLLFGMLLNLPSLLAHKLSRTNALDTPY